MNSMAASLLSPGAEVGPPPFLWSEMMAGGFRIFFSVWMRFAFPGIPYTIISAARTPEHNAEVGGAEDSAHMYGVALDVDLPGASRATLDRVVRLWSEYVPGGYAYAKTYGVHVNASRELSWLFLRLTLFAGGAWVFRRVF